MNKEYEKLYKLAESDINRVITVILSDFDKDTGINKSLLRIFKAPSKHIRALLTFLYLKAAGIKIDDRQITFQAAIELIHNGSLIHDDIIDDASTRRGEKSINTELGSHISVIAGDMVLDYALKLISELKSFEILDLILQTISKMCTGEVNQQLSKFKIPSLDDYIEKSYNKTGALFEAALEGAILISGSNITYNYKNFIKNFGIAFQIFDDIKNIKGDKSDIKSGIYTAPVIFSGNPDNPFTGIEKAKDLLDTYISKAEDFVSDLPDNEYKSAIIKLLELYRYE